MKKINNFCKKKNISITVGEENINNFRFENQSFKCSVQCPKCAKSIPCNYVSHWTCGNFQVHLKTHIENVTVEMYEVDDNLSCTKVNSSIVRLGNKSDLNKILS